jgi:hypothetical protein
MILALVLEIAFLQETTAAKRKAYKQMYSFFQKSCFCG